MTRVAKLLSVEMDAQIPKRDGSTYPGIGLTLQFSPEDIRPKGIHEKVAANNPTLVSKLKQVAVGETSDAAVVLEKNDKGFLDVVDVITDAAAGTEGVSGGGFAKRTPATNAETTARVARQNALAAAVLVTENAEQALKVAADFTDFILNSKAETGASELTGSEAQTKAETPF